MHALKSSWRDQIQPTLWRASLLSQYLKVADIRFLDEVQEFELAEEVWAQNIAPVLGTLMIADYKCDPDNNMGHSAGEHPRLSILDATCCCRLFQRRSPGWCSC
jgi:hypothetical protein